MASRRRRPSASMIVALIALIAALAGTAIAAGLTNHEQQQVKQLASGQIDKRIITVFKGISVGATDISIEKVSGFNLTASCSQGDVVVNLNPPAGIPADGWSHNSSTSDGEVAGVGEPLLVGGGEGESSFAFATKGGTVLSGQIGTDYPGSSGSFGNDSTHCAVFGHILVK